MSNTDSWWQKALKFFLPLPQEELKPVVTEDLLKKALKEAEVVLEKFDKPKVVKKSKRARGTKGRYKGDDKSTPDVNESWVGGKSPAKKPAAKKTKVTNIKKKK